MHSTNSYCHSNTSNMHKNDRNPQIDSYNLAVCTCTPPMFHYISKTLSLQIPTDAPNVLQFTSNTKHPKGSSKH
jgi:hypothetical protein